ncbi:MAG: thymidylate synthase, flavin-dependent [Planctomycetes bacterium GWF2_41_51]|nr:MAG: thymidylate synthase, flavin-dependent [Planctomycetes bacterium GWF2_41_51]
MNDNQLKVTLLAVTPDAEKLIEEAGRTCYLSFDKIGANSASDFIQRLIKMGHDSPLEHACATFRIENCSRAMTHQLVRHRLMSVSQQSQRYVDEENFNFVIPETLPKEHIAEFNADMESIRQMYKKWRDKGLKREDARFVLPNACTSEIVVTANFREWRHIIKIRTSQKAQWEIRIACTEILRILKKLAPDCFCDIETGSNIAAE